MSATTGEVRQFPVPSEATYPHAERRTDKTARILFDLQKGHEEVRGRLDDGDTRMENIEGAVKANTDITQQIKVDTSEIIDAFKSFTAAMRVLEVIGKIAKPLTYVVMLGTAIAGVVSAFKSGHFPKG